MLKNVYCTFYITYIQIIINAPFGTYRGRLIGRGVKKGVGVNLKFSLLGWALIRNGR